MYLLLDMLCLACSLPPNSCLGMAGGLYGSRAPLLLRLDSSLHLKEWCFLLGLLKTKWPWSQEEVQVWVKAWPLLCLLSGLSASSPAGQWWVMLLFLNTTLCFSPQPGSQIQSRGSALIQCVCSREWIRRMLAVWHVLWHESTECPSPLTLPFPTMYQWLSVAHCALSNIKVSMRNNKYEPPLFKDWVVSQSLSQHQQTTFYFLTFLSSSLGPFSVVFWIHDAICKNVTSGRGSLVNMAAL